MTLTEMLAPLSAPLSALLFVVGWFVTGWLNRKKDIAMKRVGYRIEALDAGLSAYFDFAEHEAPFMEVPDLNFKFKRALRLFDLYGSPEEIKVMTDLFKAINDDNGTLARKLSEQLKSKCEQSIRRELRLPKNRRSRQ